MDSKARIYGYAILIDKFESELRIFLANDILRIGYGRGWLEGIPSGIIDMVLNRSEQTEFDDPIDLLNFTEFAHLKEIALFKDNFKYSKDFFGEISRKKFNEYYIELITLRNKIAHADRNFSLLDLDILIEIITNIIKGESASLIVEFIELEKYRETEEIPTDFILEDHTELVISNLPYEDYDLEGGFVGRIEDKKKLLSLLYSDLDRVITLTGSGGVGKTALALNIAYKIRDDPAFKYSTIIWFSAKTTKLTPESIIGIVPQIKSFEELIRNTFKIFHPENPELIESIGSIEKAAEYLKKTFKESPTLLIIDNLETVLQDNDLIEYLKDIPRPSKVLITSRYGLGEVERRYPLKELSISEASRLFRLICRDKKLDAFVDLEESQVNRLVKQVNFYPLAIKWSIGKVAMGKEIEDAFKLPLDGTSDVAKFCFEDIFDILSDDAKKCIYGVSLFDEPPSSDLLSYLMEYDKDTFEKAIRELLLASLIIQQKHIQENTVITKYALLSLTQDYVREKFHKEKEIKSQLSNKFHQLSKLVEQEEKTISARSHIVWRLGVESQEDWIAVSKVRTAKQVEESGNISAANELYRDAERISPNLIYVLVSYAQFLTRTHKYAESDKRMKKAVKLEPTDFYCWFTWGVLKKRQNKIKDAKEFLEKANQLNPDDINTMIELGRVTTFRGDYSEALPILQKVLDKDLITQRQKMIVFSHIADNYRRLAGNEISKKNFDKAETLLMDAIEYIKKSLEVEPHNRKTYTIQKKIYLDCGIKLFSIGKNREAKIYLKEVLKVIKIEGREIKPFRDVQAQAYYYLAKITHAENPAKINEIMSYIKKGLAVAIEDSNIEPLQKLKVKIEGEDNRKYGKVVHVNSQKKFGLIESEGRTYIFFRDCLEWQCNNIQVLENVDVSFIPIIGYNEEHPERGKAIKINLVEPE